MAFLQSCKANCHKQPSRDNLMLSGQCGSIAYSKHKNAFALKENVISRRGTQLSAEANGQSSSENKPLPWYKKNTEMWMEIENLGHLEYMAKRTAPKYAAVDFYAPWCSSCKSAYPAMSRIASNEEFKRDFVFMKASVENETLMQFVKGEKIKGIPQWVIFSPAGTPIATFSGAFKSQETIKANLKTIAETKASSYITDPNGFLKPAVTTDV